ncbi:inosine-uridine nucleoside N-ribohydrolase [Hoeflea marina]|uniref:Inosine-uridine nucleoside N-ribohydrolase n=1 Tax=Hoeflea marina TaxID=274592 RepID=A0A317PFS2_9HYPH|nr:nucleoside hydrolase [Hoeflea marina]PWV97521.1 inosine-uridine nucleoside N-ribohydrolase [Hoeflea marina]
MAYKIILDTDPGIDDAMAIAYAIAHPDIELLALTTIFGNVRTHEATANALRLLEAWGSDADVAEGEAVPVSVPAHEPSYSVHGRNGFGDVELPATARVPHELDAVSYISEMTRRHPGEITLCAVGPLTNLARLLERDPGIVDRVRSVVVMGGAVHRPGNVTPVAEANFWHDPHAADQVLGAAWPLVLAPLDCTMPVVFTPDFMAALALESPRFGEPLADMARFYTRFYRSHLGLGGCVPHDVMALSWLTVPGAFRLQKGALAVLTEGAGIGQTVFQPGGTSSRSSVFDARPDHLVMVDTDPAMFLADYMRVLTAAADG